MHRISKHIQIVSLFLFLGLAAMGCGETITSGLTSVEKDQHVASEMAFRGIPNNKNFDATLDVQAVADGDSVKLSYYVTSGHVVSAFYIQRKKTDRNSYDSLELNDRKSNAYTDLSLSDGNYIYVVTAALAGGGYAYQYTPSIQVQKDMESSQGEGQTDQNHDAFLEETTITASYDEIEKHIKVPINFDTLENLTHFEIIRGGNVTWLLGAPNQKRFVHIDQKNLIPGERYSYLLRSYYSVDGQEEFSIATSNEVEVLRSPNDAPEALPSPVIKGSKQGLNVDLSINLDPNGLFMDVHHMKTFLKRVEVYRAFNGAQTFNSVKVKTLSQINQRVLSIQDQVQLEQDYFYKAEATYEVNGLEKVVTSMIEVVRFEEPNIMPMPVSNLNLDWDMECDLKGGNVTLNIDIHEDQVPDISEIHIQRLRMEDENFHPIPNVSQTAFNIKLPQSKIKSHNTIGYSSIAGGRYVYFVSAQSKEQKPFANSLQCQVRIVH